MKTERFYSGWFHLVKCNYIYVVLILLGCSNASKNDKVDNLEAKSVYALDSSNRDTQVPEKDSLNSFRNTKTLKKNQMKKFDFAKYKKHKSGDNAMFFVNDTTLVELSENHEYYIEKVKNPKSNLESQIQYNKISGNIEKEGNYLCGQRIGIHKEYDKTGKVARTIDYDEHFKISVKDLAKIILKECQIDIMNSKNYCSMFRLGPEPVYYYQLTVDVGLKQVIFFRIDGNTGEVLEKSYKTTRP